jgi:hypothetical protein
MRQSFIHQPVGTNSFLTILSSMVRRVDGVGMKPSSKIGLIGALAFAACWLTVDGTAAAGRSSGMSAFVGHFRVAAPKVVHTIGAGVRPLNVPVQRRVPGAVFATPLPSYLAGTFPGYATPGADYASAPSEVSRIPPSPIYYPVYPPYPPPPSLAGPAAACAPLPGPTVIEVAPSKPARNLPRVVYGTSSLCRG